MVAWHERERELPKIDAEKRYELESLYSVLDEIREAAGKVQADLDDVEAQYRDLDAAQREVFEWEKAHDARVQELEDLKHEINLKTEKLEQLELSVMPRESDLLRREQDLAEREKKQQVFGTWLRVREEELDEIEQKLEDRETDLANRERALQAVYDDKCNEEFARLKAFFADLINDVLLDLDLDVCPSVVAHALREKHGLLPKEGDWT